MFKKMIKKCLVIANLILCLSITGFSQEKKQNTFAWLNFGVGYSSLDALGGVGSFNLQYKRILFSLRGTVNIQLTEGYDLYDLGLLVGYVFRSPTWIFTVSTGVARVAGSYSWDFFSSNEPIAPVLGIPFDVQVFTRLGKYFGLGAYFYLDINSKKSFFGIAASIVAMGGYPD